MRHEIGEQIMSEQLMKELEGLDPSVLSKIASDVKVAKAKQVLTEAGTSLTELEPATGAKKPGWKTTEFWLPIILAALAALLDKLGLRDVAQLIGGGSAASALTYPLSAGMRKMKP